MIKGSLSPLRDEDLFNMLADDPELIAIADAFVTTRRDGVRARRAKAQLRFRHLGAFLAASITLVGAVALLLVAPWQGGVSVVDRARAAVGDLPVLHVVTEEPAASAGTFFDLSSGHALPRTLRTEVWFDHSRDLKKTVTSINGSVVDETLETARGGFSEAGPIFTCSWIAAHPTEATRARVSCNPNMDNGKIPRQVPEQPPSLDPALSNFVDHYQSALSSGKVKDVGRGQIDGRDIIWLELQPASPGAGQQSPERVAVDTQTYKPVAVEEAGGAKSIRVVGIDSVSFAASLFTKPQRVDSPTSGEVSSEVSVRPQEAASVLGKALWLGHEWNGLRLVETKRQEVSVRYGALPPDKARRMVGVEFVYGAISPDGTTNPHSAVLLQEATKCAFGYGWTCTPRDPSVNGTLAVEGSRSLVRLDGLYVSIWNLSGGGRTDSIAISRGLQPLTAG